ncbi:MAG: hypothetical protein KDC87_17535, partial [Planctomycetes bacterium]|nr:hypothetical protein [Planctomycetota bacterium]
MSRSDEFRFEDLEVDRLRAIRQRFLDAGESAHGIGDYWASDLDLLHYDAVFAERIGWKWDAVLDEIDARGGLAVTEARSATLLDWGCGTGIASRRFVERFGAGRVLLH